MVIPYILVIVGALNWGLVGVSDFLNKNWNVVELLLGRVSWLESVIYILVGLSALVMLFGCMKKGGNGGGNGGNRQQDQQMGGEPQV